MRMLMPSQAKKVQLYTEPTPLFVKHRVEDHLSQIYSPVVPLRSGGYLVINQTEALVAVDVNSGRSTRERNIEATALKTNMEAAEEAARQLRLRDLAGLVVIDFIDMDESKNNRAVEKKLKDSLKDDRARVQLGKISPFGLMEISRQRRRTGVLEGTTHVCEHCAGTGRVRSVESSALAALRTLEIEALKGGGEASLKVPRAVGLYILNEKRAHLARLHSTLGLFVTVVIDDDIAHAECQIERTSMETRAEHAPIAAPSAAYEPMVDDGYDDEAVDDDEEEEDDEEAIEREDTDDDQPRAAARPSRDDADGHDEDGQRRGRRRRRRGRRDGEPREAREGAAPAQGHAPRPEPAAHDDDEEGSQGRRRRRGRRGGRRMRDDSRPTDVFSWTRPWVPYGDDPFVWYDPAEDLKRAPTPANDARETPRAAAEASAPAVAVATPPRVESGDDIWVELPAVEDKPKRSRRGRGRGRG
jgi:ribonuclease E